MKFARKEVRAVQLEDYFEFEKFSTKHGEVERIRIKGHRIAMEHVLEQFRQGLEPAAIVRDIYPSLTLEEVYATILYYLHNKEAVEAYLEQGERIADAWYREYLERGPYFLRDEAQEQIAAAKAADGGQS
jgi:uncharacterized protein (DUF433 family)